jgi:hypothetical protein
MIAKLAKALLSYFKLCMLQFCYNPIQRTIFICEVTLQMLLQTGRLSLKSEALVGNIANTNLVHAHLRTIKGVLDVQTSSTTGFIGVQYNPERTSGHAILNYLIKENWIENVLPFSAKKHTANTRNAASWVEGTLAGKPRTKHINRLAITAVKLVLPLIIGKYIGRSASRFVSNLL